MAEKNKCLSTSFLSKTQSHVLDEELVADFPCNNARCQQEFTNYLNGYKNCEHFPKPTFACENSSAQQTFAGGNSSAQKTKSECKIYKTSIRRDCSRMAGILKNQQMDDPQHEENAQNLYRIILLLSYRNNSKMSPVTNYAVKFLCQHPTLPLDIVQIITTSTHLKTCTYAVEILSRLVLKNCSVSERERKTIRKLLALPANFKQALEAIKLVHEHFCHVEAYKLVITEMQTRLVKIINSLHTKKYRQQLVNIPDETLLFIKCLFCQYKSQKAIAQSLLTLIKILAKKKKNCAKLSCNQFYESLWCINKITNKIPTIIMILRYMSLNSTSLEDMSKSEKMYTLILTYANIIGEKVINKKQLMIILNRLVKTPIGNEMMSKPQNWNSLLHFFSLNDRNFQLRYRIATLKALTILYGGCKKVLFHNNFSLDLNLPNEVIVQMEVAEPPSDDSEYENEESDDDENPEEDGSSEGDSNKDLKSDSPNDCDDSSSDLEDADDEVPKTAPLDFNPDLTLMRPFFIELLPQEKLILETNSNIDEIDINRPAIKIFEGAAELLAQNNNRVGKNSELRSMIDRNVYRHQSINRHAYPDAVGAEATIREQSQINPVVNQFTVAELIKSIKRVKTGERIPTTHETVFRLDDPTLRAPVIPNPRTFKPSAVMRDCRSSSSSKSSFKTPQLEFESRFESGNLFSAVKIADFEYDLLLTPDIGTRRGCQWFYFQVAGMIAGERYTFNILNFKKATSQFNYGMQPTVFSVTDYVLNAIAWRRSGDRIVYYGNHFTDETETKQCHTLTFGLRFPHPNDYCYIAYHYPYTYTRLMTRILPFLGVNPSRIYSRIDSLCTTANNMNEVPLITITSPWNHERSLRIPFQKRPIVFLTARVHPGESNASWIMDGILQFLLDDYNEKAICVREHYIFKIVPMLNPEGVIYGNSRNGITKVDLNRCWKRPSSILHPEIYNTKLLVRFAKEQLRHPVSTFIDIHGHSRKKFFFLYGCNPKKSWTKVDRLLIDNTETCEIIPRALNLNENLKLKFCRYKITRDKEATCRVVMWREFGIQCSYTLECSYCSAEGNKKMSTKMLREIGASVVEALFELTQNPAGRRILQCA